MSCDLRIVGLIAGVPPVDFQLARELANRLDGFGIPPHDDVRSRRKHADRIDISTRSRFGDKHITRLWHGSAAGPRAAV